LKFICPVIIYLIVKINSENKMKKNLFTYSVLLTIITAFSNAESVNLKRAQATLFASWISSRDIGKLQGLATVYGVSLEHLLNSQGVSQDIINELLNQAEERPSASSASRPAASASASASGAHAGPSSSAAGSFGTGTYFPPRSSAGASASTSGTRAGFFSSASGTSGASKSAGIDERSRILADLMNSLKWTIVDWRNAREILLPAKIIEINKKEHPGILKELENITGGAIPGTKRFTQAQKDAVQGSFEKLLSLLNGSPLPAELQDLIRKAKTQLEKSDVGAAAPPRHAVDPLENDCAYGINYKNIREIIGYSQTRSITDAHLRELLRMGDNTEFVKWLRDKSRLSYEFLVDHTACPNADRNDREMLAGAVMRHAAMLYGFTKSWQEKHNLRQWFQPQVRHILTRYSNIIAGAQYEELLHAFVVAPQTPQECELIKDAVIDRASNLRDPRVSGSQKSYIRQELNILKGPVFRNYANTELKGSTVAAWNTLNDEGFLV